MGSIFITGCWEGALVSESNGLAVPFSLQQSSQPPLMARRPQVAIGNADAAPAQVLDGAAQSMVALVESGCDPETGRTGQWLVDARIHGNQMEGRWLRRDDAGHVLATGLLTAARIANG